MRCCAGAHSPCQVTRIERPLNDSKVACDEWHENRLSRHVDCAHTNVW